MTKHDEIHHLVVNKSRLNATAALPKIFTIILEGKGGVAKSVTAQATAEALRLDGATVVVAETDTTNSTMAMIGHGGGLIDASRVDAEGYFLELAENITSGQVDHVVVDGGARDEVRISPILPDLASHLRQHGAYLVVVRPIVLAHFVQANVHAFVTQVKTPEMGVVLIRNLSQGRTADMFQEWQGRKSTQELFDAGCVLCDLLNAGVEHSDNVTSFGMSLADAACGRFEKAGDLEPLARQLISRPVQLFLSKWMYRQTEAIRTAIRQAVENCE